MMYQRQQGTRKSRRILAHMWPAPVRGLLKNSHLLATETAGAEVLDNFICTNQGARIRGGSRLFATVPDAVKSIITYRSASDEKIFAATDAAIFDVSSVADPEVAPSAAVSGLGSGAWSFVQFATAGGEFLLCANGVDPVRRYDGAAWTSPTINNVSSADLSFVWSHKRRVWFTEREALSAWYLDPNAIAGDATEFPLGGVFRLGGALLFGGTWSADSGDGIDDMMVFVSTEGEIALYRGTDPDTAADWGLIGVFRIGRPLDKNGWFRAGGDLIILTEDAIVSVGEAVNKDRMALQNSALTWPIEQLWQGIVAQRQGSFPFSVTVWPTRTLLFVGVPRPGGEESALVANTRTGAWSRITGWDVQCGGVFQDRVYFGTSSGAIIEGDTGGNDLGLPYEARYVGTFQTLRTTDDKIAVSARVIWRGEGTFKPVVSTFTDWRVGAYPQAVVDIVNNPNVWGVGEWGSFIWGSAEIPAGYDLWRTVAGSGMSIAPVVVVGSQKLSLPAFELIGLELRHEIGRGM